MTAVSLDLGGYYGISDICTTPLRKWARGGSGEIGRNGSDALLEALRMITRIESLENALVTLRSAYLDSALRDACLRL